MSACFALLLLVVSSRQAKRRATVDLLLQNNTHPALVEAKKKVAQFHAQKLNFRQFASVNLTDHEENQYIMAVLNNYEFIATGIKEGAFDEEIYRRMTRTLLLRDWNGLCQFVEDLRQATGKDVLFVEFEWLAYKFRNTQPKPKISMIRRIASCLGM